MGHGDDGHHKAVENTRNNHLTHRCTKTAWDMEMDSARWPCRSRVASSAGARGTVLTTVTSVGLGRGWGWMGFQTAAGVLLTGGVGMGTFPGVWAMGCEESRSICCTRLGFKQSSRSSAAWYAQHGLLVCIETHTGQGHARHGNPSRTTSLTQQRGMVHPAQADGCVGIRHCDLVHPHIGCVGEGNGIVAPVRGVLAVRLGAAEQGGNQRGAQYGCRESKCSRL